MPSVETRIRFLVRESQHHCGKPADPGHEWGLRDAQLDPRELCLLFELPDASRYHAEVITGADSEPCSWVIHALPCLQMALAVPGTSDNRVNFRISLQVNFCKDISWGFDSNYIEYSAAGRSPTNITGSGLLTKDSDSPRLFGF